MILDISFLLIISFIVALCSLFGYAFYKADILKSLKCYEKSQKYFNFVWIYLATLFLFVVIICVLLHYEIIKIGV